MNANPVMSPPTFSINFAEAFAVPAGNPNNLLTYEDIAANTDLKMTTCAGCAEEKICFI